MNGTSSQPLMLTAPQLHTVTIGDSVTRPDKLVRIQLQSLMANIKSSRYKALIEPVRAETDPDKRAELKRKLPYFVYSLFNGPRSEQNVIQANGIVCSQT